MLHWLSTAFSTYVLHPEHGNGYQWHSGIGANLGQYTIVSALLLHIKHRNCHHKRCWRTWPFVHLHPEYGWPACRIHWNEKPEHVA